MEDPVLTRDEITSFEELGYVHVSQAFPRESALAMQDFMWSELKHLSGIDRVDRSTWPIHGEGSTRPDVMASTRA
jgi:hypothetical protein